MFDNNAIFFSPINTSNDTTYYGVNKMKTGLVKYAADETLFNYKTIKFFDSAPPKYIYIHCP